MKDENNKVENIDGEGSIPQIVYSNLTLDVIKDAMHLIKENNLKKPTRNPSIKIKGNFYVIDNGNMIIHGNHKFFLDIKEKNGFEEFTDEEFIKFYNSLRV